MPQICRTCLQQISSASFIRLSGELRAQLAVCVPEMIVGLVTQPEPVLCAACANALRLAYNFKSQCLETEERIRSFVQRKCSGISLEQVVQQGSVAGFAVKEEFGSSDESEASKARHVQNENLDMSPRELQTLLQQKARHKYMGDKPHKCDKCPFSAIDRSTLKKHKATHSDERPYKCTLCSYRTKRKDALTLHAKRHRKVKPHICPQCKYSTVTKQCLRRHVMVAHLGLRPFKCDLCHFTFPDRGALTKHMLIHTDVKPYECNMCNFSTKRKYTLSNHMKSHGKGTI